jgi:hypothetical protein
MFTTLRKAALALVVTVAFAGVAAAAPHGGVHAHAGGYHGGSAHYGGYHGGFAHYGGYHGNYYRHAHYGYYGHAHYGPYWGFYGYAPYYSGYYWPSYYSSYSLSVGPAYYYAPAPAYYYSSPVISTYAAEPATIVTRASTPERIPAPRDELPAPTESKSFRYDGDRPAAPPVERIPPARELDVPKVPELPGVPRLGPTPADMAITVPASSVTKKYAYQAYGEDRLAKPSPRDDKSVLIRRDR